MSMGETAALEVKTLDVKKNEGGEGIDGVRVVALFDSSLEQPLEQMYPK